MATTIWSAKVMEGGDLGRSGQIWADLGRSGQIWGVDATHLLELQGHVDLVELFHLRERCDQVMHLTPRRIRIIGAERAHLVDGQRRSAKVGEGGSYGEIAIIVIRR